VPSRYRFHTRLPELRPPSKCRFRARHGNQSLSDANRVSGRAFPAHGETVFGRQRRNAQTASRRSFFLTETVNLPMPPRQTVENRGCSAETRKSQIAQDCVVGPGVPPTWRVVKELSCPTGSNGGLEDKRESARLSNRFRRCAESAEPAAYLIRLTSSQGEIPPRTDKRALPRRSALLIPKDPLAAGRNNNEQGRWVYPTTP
jgi:hypothetical protein